MMTTPSFRALIKGMIDNDAQATVRNLEYVHVGRKTRDRFLKAKAQPPANRPERLLSTTASGVRGARAVFSPPNRVIVWHPAPDYAHFV